MFNVIWPLARSIQKLLLYGLNDFVLIASVGLAKVLIYVPYVVELILVLLVSTQQSLCGLIQFPSRVVCYQIMINSMLVSIQEVSDHI